MAGQPVHRIDERPLDVSPAALRTAGVAPLLARLYAARGVDRPELLEAGLDRLPDPGSMPGMAEAVAVLLEARAAGTRICIVGDYDADGATATAVLREGLTGLGFPPPDHLVPNRFEYGYGLTPEIVALAAERPGMPAPGLIVTVDNGIASVDGVRAASALGIDVLVTDHHLPGAELPPARALLNPRLGTPGGPLEALAGVGVVFFLLVALRRHMRDAGLLSGNGPNLAQLLDLVALGTVADVVPLTRVNRILVEQGLRRIRAGHGRPGILALAEVSGRDPGRLYARDFGFALAPRLNAAGRLTDMSVGIELLLQRDPVRAREIAGELDGLNRERRRIEADMRDAALASADRLEREESLPWGLCLFEPDWHPGVVGIVAARVRERFHRPVIAFAPDADAMLRGSARSVPGLHVRDALEAVATRHPGLVHRFGGHAMAAGLALAEADLAAFSAAFDAEVRRHLVADDLDAVFVTDGELTADELNLDTARRLETAGPWGQGFPEPLFHGVFDVVDARIVGEAHVRLELATGTVRLGGIAFGGVEHGWHRPPGRVRLVYRLEVNRWRGTETPQLMVLHLQSA